MEWNRIHFTNIARLFRITKFITPATIWNQAGYSARIYGSNPINKQNTYTKLPHKLLLETAKKVDFKENEDIRHSSTTIPNLIVVTERSEQTKHSELKKRARNINHHAFRFIIPFDSGTERFHKIGSHFDELRNTVEFQL